MRLKNYFAPQADNTRIYGTPAVTWVSFGGRSMPPVLLLR
jgi:hypothetical protein